MILSRLSMKFWIDGRQTIPLVNLEKRTRVEEGKVWRKDRGSELGGDGWERR